MCDYGWDQYDAQVACRQLGFDAGAEAALGQAQFGEGTGLPIWMGNVRCSGMEKNIQVCYLFATYWRAILVILVLVHTQDCAFDSRASNSCSHRQDAGVICST